MNGGTCAPPAIAAATFRASSIQKWRTLSRTKMIGAFEIVGLGEGKGFDTGLSLYKLVSDSALLLR